MTLFELWPYCPVAQSSTIIIPDKIIGIIAVQLKELEPAENRVGQLKTE